MEAIDCGNAGIKMTRKGITRLAKATFYLALIGLTQYRQQKKYA